MAKKRVSHVQFGLSCVLGLEQNELPLIHFHCLVIALLFATSLLDICLSAENVSGEMSDSHMNSTTEDKLILMTTVSNIRPTSNISQNEKEGNQNKLLDAKHSTDILKNKQRLPNDIIKRFGLNSTDSNKSSEQEVYLRDLTNHVENETQSESTTEPDTYSRRPIYIRGHLLEHRPSGKKTFHPPDTPEGYFRTNNSIHLHRVLNFRKDSDSENTSNRQKRKHIPNKERFHNYKMLYDSINGNEDDQTKRTEFYAWMFGAAMLGLGSLTTVTTCIVFCFCGNKNQQTKNTGVRPRNTPSRHSGEYQRVESVSSIVDHAGDYTDSLYEEHRHSVTII